MVQRCRGVDAVQSARGFNPTPGRTETCKKLHAEKAGRERAKNCTQQGHAFAQDKRLFQ